MKVLIVEDSRETSEILSNALSHLDATIQQVAHMASALQERDSFKPDIIILDANLPDSPASLTLKRIKDFRTYGAVIIASGNNDKLFINEAILNGADAFLDKNSCTNSSLMLILRRAWSAFVKRSGESSESLSAISNTLSIENPIDAVLRMTKSGKVSKLVSSTVKTDPVGAELLVQVLSIKDHLNLQDQTLSAHQNTFDKILQQTTLHNGRLTEIEDWREEVQEKEQTIQDKEALRSAWRDGVKFPFKVGWKTACILFTVLVCAVTAGSAIKDFLLRLAQLLGL